MRKATRLTRKATPSSRPKPSIRAKPGLFKLAIVHVPFRSLQFICCGRLILGRPETFRTPMLIFTITTFETFEDRQHGPGGQASAPFELPCLHLPHPSSRRYNCRCPRPRLRAGGRLLLRCMLLLACLLHHVLHLESVAEAVDSVEMQPCKTGRAKIAAVFLTIKII